MEIRYERRDEIGFVVWNMTSSPMNVLNDLSISMFEVALKQAFADDTKGIVITSDKPEFIAGADLKMILRNNDKEPAEMLKVSQELNQVFRAIELSGKPTVAAINGTALGGGYEVCLACHRRIALNNPKSLIGLVESTVGLLPGAGGTQRLPRIVGLEKGLALIIEGKKVSVQEAKNLGMINDIAANYDELLSKATNWILANQGAIQPWDEFVDGKVVAKNKMDIPGGNPGSEEGKAIIEAAQAQMLRKSKGNYPALFEIINTVRDGLSTDIDSGIDLEAHAFMRVGRSVVAKNLISVMFLGMNEINKGMARPKHISATNVQKLGIVGSGFMGAGVAYVAAQAGINVILKDLSIDTAERGKDYARKLIQKGIDKGITTAQKGEILLANITTTALDETLAGSDLVIEAVFENQDLKHQIIKSTEGFINSDGVFASNTSTIPISNLAVASAKPENFIGIHFFSPVDKMQLVEIIVGQKTSDHAIALAFDFVKKIRKIPIVVNDSRGFYTSRTFSTYTAEGLQLLREGVDPRLIEEAGLQAGMPVGPLAVSDEVALDLSLKISNEYVASGTLPATDGNYLSTKLLVETHGRFGRKNKKGFYDYTEDGKKKLWSGLAELFPVAATQPSIEEIKERLMIRQSVEAFKCLDEGVLRTKLEGNIGSILGWGFPTYTGGTLNYPDLMGREIFIQKTKLLATKCGERYALTAPQEDLVMKT